MSLAGKAKADFEKVGHAIVSAGKEIFVALHGEEKAKEALPILGDIIKKKADELLAKGAAKL